MTRIGFIGGGAIGGAVAFDRYEIAIVLAAVNYATLRWLSRLKADASLDHP